MTGVQTCALPDLGVLRGRFTYALAGRGDIFGTTFRPAGFRPLLGRAVAGLTDQVVDGSVVFGTAAADFAGRIAAAQETAERIAIAANFVRDRLPGALPRSVGSVNALVEAIETDRTILKVDDLVDRHAIGKRYLQKLFREYVGVTPKWVIQRYRLHEAAERLADPETDLAGLAAELGYADQAHFARDFKAATGRPPASYVRS